MIPFLGAGLPHACDSPGLPAWLRVGKRADARSRRQSGTGPVRRNTPRGPKRAQPHNPEDAGVGTQNTPKRHDSTAAASPSTQGTPESLQPKPKGEEARGKAQPKGSAQHRLQEGGRG